MDQEKDRRQGEEDIPVYGEIDDYQDVPVQEADAATMSDDQQRSLAAVRRILGEMQDYVSSAKRGFLTQDVLVDRDIMTDNLQRLWDALPVALTEGENVLRERARILAEAKEIADNTRRSAENEASQMKISAENTANRKIQDANEYYSQHKADGDAYLVQCQQTGDSYANNKKAEADEYANRTAHNAQASADSMLANANKQAQDMMRQEVVYCRAEIAAQELRSKSEADYAARMTEAANNANALYGNALKQTKKLLEELHDFQKKQNTELLAYCNELEQRHVRK